MISIIVSTYNPKKFENLQANIRSTIGDTAYEIIRVENPGLMGICKAYNFGASQASFSNLLFIHDDIEFIVNNWGGRIVKHLTVNTHGIFGVAGGNYIPKAPSGWFIKTGASALLYPKETKVLDGVFLAMNSMQYAEFPFNEQIKGFHGYDTEICIRSSLKYKNYLIDDIKIVHHSGGSPDNQWLKNNIQIRDLYGNKMQAKKNAEFEELAFIRFFRAFFKYNNFNLTNFRKVMNYYPILELNFGGHLRVFRQIGSFIKYRKNLR